MEGVQSSVFSAFLAMILFQTVNLVSIGIVIKIFHPLDFSSMNKFVLFMIFTFPPMVFNYQIIYHKSGYKKILKEYSHVKQGSLLYIAVYLIITLAVMIGAVYLLNTAAKNGG
jgi:hypothetical protein